MSIHDRSIKGHLSVDYTCMKWLSLERKRKRKHGSSLLILGTGSGDILAHDVSASQLHWRISDCHPGGVRAISSSANGSSIYMITNSRGAALEPLLQLSGRLQLMTTQINKASQSISCSVCDLQMEEIEDEDEEDDYFREGDDAFEISSDDES